MKKVEFSEKAEVILDTMKAKADELGVKGVAVVCSLEKADSNDWVTAMRVVEKTRTEPKEDNKGFNFIGVVYAKAAEMMDTRMNSGSRVRPIIVGELGYKGGMISPNGEGFLVTAFSGASSDQDLEISQCGQDFLNNL